METDRTTSHREAPAQQEEHIIAGRMGAARQQRLQLTKEERGLAARYLGPPSLPPAGVDARIENVVKSQSCMVSQSSQAAKGEGEERGGRGEADGGSSRRKAARLNALVVGFKHALQQRTSSHRSPTNTPSATGAFPYNP